MTEPVAPKLGENYAQNWKAYLQRIKDNNLQRGEGRATDHDAKRKKGSEEVQERIQGFPG